MARTRATAEVSHICVSGQHWGCENCCPQLVCPEHTRRRLLATGSLWFRTAGLERVCERGCAAEPTAPAHVCTRTTFWAGSLGLVSKLPGGHRILGGTPPFAAAVLLKRTGCELVALDAGSVSVELTGRVHVAGFADSVLVRVLIPQGCAVGGTLAYTCAVDLAGHWPLVTVVPNSSATRRQPVPSHCAAARYWWHRQAPRPPPPCAGGIVWHAAPADVLPPPEAAGHVPQASGAVGCAWCGTVHRDMARFLATCAPDSQREVGLASALAAD